MWGGKVKQLYAVCWTDETTPRLEFVCAQNQEAAWVA